MATEVLQWFQIMQTCSKSLRNWWWNHSWKGQMTQ